MEGILIKPLTQELAEKVIRGEFIPCEYIHSYSCLRCAFYKFFSVLKLASTFYLAYNILPLLLFHRNRLRKKPVQMMKKVIRNILRSALFWASYVSVFRYLLCFFKNKRGKIDRWNVIYSSFLCTFAIFFEPSHRRTELALFMIPRFLEACYILLQKLGLVWNFEYGEVLIFSLAMGIIMFFYENEEKNIESTYLSLFKRFWK